MFRKLFVFVVVLILVLGFVVVLDAVFYSGDASDSAVGDGDLGIESVEDAEMEEDLPVSHLKSGQERTLFSGSPVLGMYDVEVSTELF